MTERERDTYLLDVVERIRTKCPEAQWRTHVEIVAPVLADVLHMGETEVFILLMAELKAEDEAEG